LLLPSLRHEAVDETVCYTTPSKTELTRIDRASTSDLEQREKNPNDMLQDRLIEIQNRLLVSGRGSVDVSG
jgi:hypothetical protein